MKGVIMRDSPAHLEYAARQRIGELARQAEVARREAWLRDTSLHVCRRRRTMRNRGRWFHPERHERSRLFEKGDLKYIILELVAEKARHGYEVIRALEGRFSGFYAASPGAVYPTLQMLEDMGYVTGSERDGKKVYDITDEGRRFLTERREVVSGIHERIRAWWNPSVRDDLRRLLGELREMAEAIRGTDRREWAKPEKLRRIREVIQRARGEIEEILSTEGESVDG
jgi:DNA-binding PadR family transcriptional regulator